MPAAPVRPCTHPGCRVLTATGRCEAHERKAWRTSETERRTTTERGYGWRWQQLREQVLARDRYLCQCPDCKGGAVRLTVATEVDHIIPKAQWSKRRGTEAGVDDPSNLQAIGHECHERKTAAENGKALRSAIGADGYPVEAAPRGGMQLSRR